MGYTGYSAGLFLKGGVWGGAAALDQNLQEPPVHWYI